MLRRLISGIYQPDVGTMSPDGVNLIGMSAQRRVRHGLARTFQKIRLFKQLSAVENAIAGYHTRHAIAAWQYVFHGSAFREDARGAATRRSNCSILSD
jgi:branched-chain amino acid transport system ATP-binding protein